MFTFTVSMFVLAAICYLLFITSDPLEKVGGRIGKLLHLPEDVVAATFQATATSGPEIVMAILAATPFVASDVWSVLELGERASSGTLNMAFSAMDNLLGIGAMAIIAMIWMGKVKREDKIPMRASTVISLIFYIAASGFLSISLIGGVLTPKESWILMYIGIAFVLSQFIFPRFFPDPPSDEEDDDDDFVMPSSVPSWAKEFGIATFIYAALVFALIIFVREAIGATFNMATIGVASVGGILLLFTSYVSSFPEFVMSVRYVLSNKRDALLAMLFGSNVIDLAFAGFRAMWLDENMAIYTTGRIPQLLNVYVFCLPVIAIAILVGLLTKKLCWKHAFGMAIFYIFYILSGFILL